ncbi:MAG TPA: HAD family hydrolase [Polyangia bacterium]|nr:HAD family hydrolase [Polyangia bacterium]
MRYHVLATDYDGTLAEQGAVAPTTLAVLERMHASGRKLILVTGREIDDLLRVFPDVAIFDLVVAENGAVVYNPATRDTRDLAERPPAAFVERLRQRGVQPLSVGRVIVATWQPHEAEALEAIRTLGLELQVIFNKGAVMVLPSGINKAVGLRAALDQLGLSVHNTVAVGDAENDHAFLSVCECAVAVANALDTLKQHADLVTEGARGDGVRELGEALLANDLAAVEARLGRHHLTIGKTVGDGAAVRVRAYGDPILIAGTSGGGKSTLATALLEALAANQYQFCVVDPEGDHVDLPEATVLGGADRPPKIDELLDVLAKPRQNLVANLIGIGAADRPAFVDALWMRVRDLRARTGRPHWLIIDEAHHVWPRERGPAAAVPAPAKAHNLVLITVHPEHVAPEALASVELAIAVGVEPARTLVEFARAIDAAPPGLPPEPLPAGEALAWRPREGGPPFRFAIDPPRAERRRHIRKYAAGELGPDKSFYFRGPDQRLNLRAQNLQTFLQVADGVDDDTWQFHLGRGDYSAWFRDAIKDPALAAEAAAVERTARLDPAQSRARIKAAVHSRYTAPA